MEEEGKQSQQGFDLAIYSFIVCRKHRAMFTDRGSHRLEHD